MTASRKPVISRRRSAAAWVGVVLAFGALPVVAYVRNRPLPPDRIAWRTDFAAALRDAAITGRPVLVDVAASWCPPCQEMKKSAWPDPRVNAIVTSAFTPVYLDVDVPASGAVATHYGVFSLPTILVLEADGSVRDVGGIMDADELHQFLSDHRAPTTAPTTRP